MSINCRMDKNIWYNSTIKCYLMTKKSKPAIAEKYGWISETLDQIKEDIQTTYCMVPLIWWSGKAKLWQKADQWLPKAGCGGGDWL